jgi:hypothetical protein
MSCHDHRDGNAGKIETTDRFFREPGAFYASRQHRLLVW